MTGNQKNWIRVLYSSLLDVAKGISIALGSYAATAYQQISITSLLSFFSAVQPFAIVLAVIALIIDIRYQHEERVARAWQRLSSTQTGNTAIRESLEYLNHEGVWFFGKRRVSLDGIEVTPPYLTLVGQQEAQLSLDAQDCFKFVNLQRIKLPSAELSDAKFTCADLRQANFQNAMLYRADFRNARMWNANLHGARLQGAKFDGADLWKADLRGAQMQLIHLTPDHPDVNLPVTYYIVLESGRSVFYWMAGDELRSEPALVEDAIETSLVDTDLQGADLSGANLQSADLQRSDLQNAQIPNAILTGVDFRNADLRGANLQFATLTLSDLRNARITDAVLTGSVLGQADLRGIEGATCEQLMVAEKWEFSYRDAELACGEAIPEVPEDS